MKKWKFITSIGLATFALAACSNEDEPKDHTTPPVEQPAETEQETPTEVETPNMTVETVQQYFAPDGSHLHYRGVGSEFAELDIQVRHIGEHYVALVESNGGSVVTTVYALEDGDLIRVLREMTEFEETETGEMGDYILPTVERLDASEERVVVYREDAKKGDTFTIDDATWTIIDPSMTLKTDTETYEDVIHMQVVNEELTSDYYYKVGIGLIKHHDVMETEDKDNPFIVDSELESIEQQ